MGKIGNVAVVGMGALGLLFGQRIRENIGDEHLFFLMDPMPIILLTAILRIIKYKLPEEILSFL